MRNKDHEVNVIKDRLPAALTGSTKVLAVFGCPVEHSLSPAMHNAAIAALGLDYIYVPFHVEPAGLADAIAGVRAMGFAGVNLTIPLKEAAVDMVDGLSEQAARVRSVNTLWWNNGRLMGDSTDGEGFLRSLQAEVEIIPSQALVLGAGGSSRAICFALAERGVNLTIANRTVERARRIAGLISGVRVDVINMDECALRSAAGMASLIVNCTPVGMTPRMGESPLDKSFISSRHVVYDLVYNPIETTLMQDAKQQGAKAINGVKMLVCQGAVSFELWTGVKPPLEIMEDEVLRTLQQAAL